MICIRAYRAIDEPQTCLEYINGHVKVLRDYGIESITSNTNTWLNNPNMYCYIATDETGQMIGGIRIQVADGITGLPVECAVKEMDSRIIDLINHYRINGGVGELCGLWNSNKFKGVGISFVLVRAAISTINQLNFKTLTGICAEYSLKMFQNVGFVINHELGNNGNFTYPNENYIAHVVGILNGVTLSTATDYDKERMLSLRDTPTLRRAENGSRGEFEVEYDLVFKKINSARLKTESMTV